MLSLLLHRNTIRQDGLHLRIPAMGISLAFTGMILLIAVSLRRFLKSSIVVSIKRQDSYRNGKVESCKCADHVFETDDCRYPCDGKWGKERWNRL
jgi:hypothetical protein